jgi:hypothetical protein
VEEGEEKELEAIDAMKPQEDVLAKGQGGGKGGNKPGNDKK